MTDLTPHMTPAERKRYQALQVLLDRGDAARSEMNMIRRRVRARLRRAALSSSQKLYIEELANFKDTMFYGLRKGECYEK